MGRRPDVAAADVTLRRLLAVAAAIWVGRWAALQVAAYTGYRWPRRGNRPVDPSRRPGWMPGPFDR